MPDPKPSLSHTQIPIRWLGRACRRFNGLLRCFSPPWEAGGVSPPVPVVRKLSNDKAPSVRKAGQTRQKAESGPRLDTRGGLGSRLVTSPLPILPSSQSITELDAPVPAPPAQADVPIPWRPERSPTAPDLPAGDAACGGGGGLQTDPIRGIPGGKVGRT